MYKQEFIIERGDSSSRRHLAIIGDSSTVSHEPFLNELLDHISSAGEVQSAFDYIHGTILAYLFYEFL